MKRIWVKVVEMGISPDPNTGDVLMKVKLEGGASDTLLIQSMEIQFKCNPNTDVPPWTEGEDYILELRHRDEKS